MKKIKPQDVLSFLPSLASNCLSIYVNERREIPERIEEVRTFAANELRVEVAEMLLRPIEEYYEARRWNEMDGPMAFFVSEEVAGYSTLPFETKSLAVLARSFHVKPLVKWLQRDRPFHLLHLGLDRARLYRGSLGGFQLQDTHEYKGARTLEGICQSLKAALAQDLANTSVPLILAGYDLITQTFRRHCEYRQTMNRSISDLSSNPRSGELHSKSLELLEPYLQQTEENLIREFWLAKKMNRTSSSLNEVIQLALKGRVEHLFVNEKMNVWGQIDYDTGKFEYLPNQYDLPVDDILDDLAELVLMRHGKVTVLPSERMPDSQAAAAILKVTVAPETMDWEYGEREGFDLRWIPA